MVEEACPTVEESIEMKIHGDNDKLDDNSVSSSLGIITRYHIIIVCTLLPPPSYWTTLKHLTRETLFQTDEELNAEC